VPVRVVPAGPADDDFLAEMLVAAACWRLDGPLGDVHSVLTRPELAHYVSGWPRPGDLGVVAEDGYRSARHGCASCPSTTVDRHLGTSGLSRGCSTTTGRTSSWLTAERSRYGEVDRDECRDDAGRLCGSGSVGWLVAVAVLRRVAARARCAGLGLRCSARGRRPRPRPFGRARGGWWGDGAIDHRSRVGCGPPAFMGSGQSA